MKASDYLRTAAEVIEQRGQLRDKPDGERSMERAVDAYITLNGPQMQTELDGWIFMSILKLARATAGKPHIDDWTDLAGYAALAAECVEKSCKITPSSGDVFEDLERPWIAWTGPWYSTVKHRLHEYLGPPGLNGEVVEVRFRNGELETGDDWYWEWGSYLSDEPHEHDIVAYRSV